MGTHYHTLLDTPRGNLSDFMRTLNTGYSKAFDRRHERVGHTFEQRFRSIVVQREKYLRRVARYIALNPVKARLCPDAADWHLEHVSRDRRPRRPASLALPGLAAMGLSRRRGCPRPSADIARTWRIRPRSPGRSSMTTALGTDRFKRAVAGRLARCGQNRPIPVDCRRCARPPLEQLFSR